MLSAGVKWVDATQRAKEPARPGTSGGGVGSKREEEGLSVRMIQLETNPKNYANLG